MEKKEETDQSGALKQNQNEYKEKQMFYTPILGE